MMQYVFASEAQIGGRAMGGRSSIMVFPEELKVKSGGRALNWAERPGARARRDDAHACLEPETLGRGEWRAPVKLEAESVTVQTGRGVATL